MRSDTSAGSAPGQKGHHRIEYPGSRQRADRLCGDPSPRGWDVDEHTALGCREQRLSMRRDRPGHQRWRAELRNPASTAERQHERARASPAM